MVLDLPSVFGCFFFYPTRDDRWSSIVKKINPLSSLHRQAAMYGAHSNVENIVDLCSSGDDSASTTDSDENVKRYERELEARRNAAPIAHRTRSGSRTRAFEPPTHPTDFMADSRFGYLYGRTDTHPQLQVRRLYSGQYGYGVVTTVPIAAHTYVTPYAGSLAYESLNIVHNPEKLTHTIKLTTCGHDGCGNLLLLHGFKRWQLRHGRGVGSMVNHSDQPNCELVVQPYARFSSRIVAFIKATGNIAAGTELTINYGRGYFAR